MLQKTIPLIVGLFFTSIVASAQNVTFAGTADKKFDGNKIVLYNRVTGDHDSAVIQDGKFVFTVKFKEPTRYMFYSDYQLKTKGGYSPYGILVTEAGTVTINADAENFSNTKVKGAKENDLYNKFAEISSKSQQKILDDLTVKYGKEFINNRNSDTSDIKYKQLIQDYNEMSAANQKIETGRLTKFIKSNAGSFAAVYLLDGNARNLELPVLESLFETLSVKYKESRSGKSIANGIEARKITAIGKTAPEFSQPDTLGNVIKLSSFKGKYVLIDFWASWCGPCRAENPNLVRTFNKYNPQGFTVLGVSLDQPGKKDSWLAAIHKDNLTWTQVSDLKYWDNEVALLYGVKAIPANLLLDKDGKIIAKDLRGADLDNKLKEIFGN